MISKQKLVFELICGVETKVHCDIIITDLELESDIIKIFNFMYKKFHSHYVPEFITELYCPLKRVLESCNLKL